MASVTSYTKDALDTLLDNKANRDGDEILTGQKTFGTTPILPASSPTMDTHAASKKYVDDAVNSAQGYSVVNSIDEIPTGAPPGRLYLVINSPELAVAPEIIASEAFHGELASSTIDVPTLFPEAQVGDLVVCLLSCQKDSDLTWSVASPETSPWEIIYQSEPNADRRTIAIAVAYLDDLDIDDYYTINAVGGANQRKVGVAALIRNAALSDAVSVGELEAENGVGDIDVTAPSVLSTSPKGLHLVLAYSNGSPANGNSTADPTVSGGMSLVEKNIFPAEPTAGFTTAYMYSRTLDVAGPSGSINVNFPHLSQRAAVSVVVSCLED